MATLYRNANLIYRNQAQGCFNSQGIHNRGTKSINQKSESSPYLKRRLKPETEIKSFLNKKTDGRNSGHCFKPTIMHQRNIFLRSTNDGHGNKQRLINVEDPDVVYGVWTAPSGYDEWQTDEQILKEKIIHQGPVNPHYHFVLVFLFRH